MNLPGFEPVILPALRGIAGRVNIRIGRLEPDASVRMELSVFRKDVVVRVKAVGMSKRHQKPKLRGDIKGFSRESAKRLKFLIRNTSDLWQGFLTLTYPKSYPMSGPETKRHIHAFCTWLGREKIAYVWILEFQRRGAPHFHFLLSGFLGKARVKRKWADIVGSQDPRHFDQGAKIEAVKNPDEVGIYMAKYMGKMDQKEVPLGFEKVGRFWGASRCLTKVMYKFDGLYREAARELRTFRDFNQASRRNISQEQAARAADFQKKAGETRNPQDRAKFLIYARTARRAALSYAKRWRWRGYGFVLIRGSMFFKSLMRQAVLLDSGKTKLMAGPGRDVWHEFNGSPDAKKPYVPLWAREVQLMLDGEVDADSLPDQDFFREQENIKL
ncbi:MAG: hypothetical protein AABY22_03915, partial [Nanoarchaeota archaeon]